MVFVFIQRTLHLEKDLSGASRELKSKMIEAKSIPNGMKGTLVMQRKLGDLVCHSSKRLSFASASVTNTHFQNKADSLEQADSLDLSKVPKHVAFIMDGNSRWAEERGLPRNMGHLAGVKKLREVVRLSSSWKIEALTIFAFSTENWMRSKREVDFLMNLFEEELAREAPILLENKISLRVIGDISQLPESLQQLILQINGLLANETGLKINLAVNYSGRQDLTRAVQKVALRVAEGKLSPNEISEGDIERELSTSWLGPDLASPDLMIRTSGEKRISNFLLWQTAYTELVFCDVLWPDFGEQEFRQALIEFQSRQRRFGGRKSK